MMLSCTCPDDHRIPPETTAIVHKFISDRAAFTFSNWWQCRPLHGSSLHANYFPSNRNSNLSLHRWTEQIVSADCSSCHVSWGKAATCKTLDSVPYDEVHGENLKHTSNERQGLSHAWGNSFSDQLLLLVSTVHCTVQCNYFSHVTIVQVNPSLSLLVLHGRCYSVPASPVSCFMTASQHECSRTGSGIR